MRIGYVMGTGDLVPEAIEGMGVDAASALPLRSWRPRDLSAWNVIVIGIRAYSVRPELTAAQPRLDEFVRRGGTLIVQYQSGNFPCPVAAVDGTHAGARGGRDSAGETARSDQSPAHLAQRITARRFRRLGRGARPRLPRYLGRRLYALTETADPGQDPQRGGLLVAHPGKGTYIYVAYALYRQLPELVPGAYRLLANLLSAGKKARSEQTGHS